jgi:hypothetical protein
LTCKAIDLEIEIGKNVHHGHSTGWSTSKSRSVNVSIELALLLSALLLALAFLRFRTAPGYLLSRPCLGFAHYLRREGLQSKSANRVEAGPVEQSKRPSFFTRVPDLRTARDEIECPASEERFWAHRSRRFFPVHRALGDRGSRECRSAAPSRHGRQFRRKY